MFSTTSMCTIRVVMSMKIESYLLYCAYQFHSCVKEEKLYFCRKYCALLVMEYKAERLVLTDDGKRSSTEEKIGPVNAEGRANSAFQDEGDTKGTLAVLDLRA